MVLVSRLLELVLLLVVLLLVVGLLIAAVTLVLLGLLLKLEIRVDWAGLRVDRRRRPGGAAFGIVDRQIL